MTLGPGTFVPNPRFAFPRSYIAGFWFNFNSNAVVNWTVNRATFLDPPSGVHGAVSVAHELYTWSSNAYTMDRVVTESWYSFPGPVVENPLPFALTFYIEPVSCFPYFVFDPFSSPGTGIFKHLFPFAPPDYWGPHFDL